MKQTKLKKWNGNCIKKKKRSSADHKVSVKVGLVYNHDGELKQKRGSTLPIEVKSNSTDISLKRAAIEKHLAFNKHLPRDHQFLLLYPDFQEVKYIPGSRQPFTLKQYKECLGKAYQRITLYLCDEEDFTTASTRSSDSDDYCKDNIGSKSSKDDLDKTLDCSSDSGVVTFNPQFATSQKTDAGVGCSVAGYNFSDDDDALYLQPVFSANYNLLQDEGITTCASVSGQDNCQETIATQQEQEVQITRKLRLIEIHRLNIRNDMIDIFSDKSILNDNIEVVFVTQKGEREKGKGSGLVRDAFSLFWNDIYDSLMLGEKERVPCIRHDFQRLQWEAIGRILVSGYLNCQYLPIKLSKTFLSYCLFGESSITPKMLIDSFRNYVSESEVAALNRCLSKNIQDFDDEITELLSNFECKRIIKKENMTNIITEIAHKELIQRPQYVADCWKEVLVLLRSAFPSISKLNVLYDELLPSNTKVLEKISAVTNNVQEQETLKHLKRYIRGLDSANLAKFLRFVCGSELMLFPEIQVTFTQLEGVARRPIAHTCNYILELSTTYQSSPELREEFNGILAVDNWEIDIA